MVVYRRWSDGTIGMARTWDDVPRGADVLKIERDRIAQPPQAAEGNRPGTGDGAQRRSRP